jgi:hypothetical protein
MPLPSNIPKRGLNLDEASEYCGVSDKTLIKYGPSPSKIGERNIYDIRVLDQWLDSIASLPVGTGASRIEDPEEELLKAIHARKNKTRPRRSARPARKRPVALGAAGPSADVASGQPSRSHRDDNGAPH